LNSKERLLAAIDGKGADRKPAISWPEIAENSDVEVRLVGQPFQSDRVRLTQISNPFGHAATQGKNLTALLRSNIEEGEAALLTAASEVKSNIESASKGGADGILYLLHGAEPRLSTPMEYGGHFLEVDRELLSNAGPLRIVFVVGGEGTFLDFVSDLPAEVFSWDTEGTAVTPDQLRAMRKGAVATADPSGDIQLTHVGDVSPKIKIQQLANV
jgi:hypothetical protein